MNIERAPLKDGNPASANEPTVPKFLSAGALQSIGHFLLFLLVIAVMYQFSVSSALGIATAVGGALLLIFVYWMAAMLHHQERIDRALNRTDDTKDTD